MKNGPQVLFVSHGGGPLPLLGDEGHSSLIKSLKTVAQDLVKPKAIVVFSAHWEEHEPVITSVESPELIYDYYGFPPESYEIQYPAPGNPTLASDIYSMLAANGLTVKLDDSRGLDHGVFVPLKLMYPDADIPCIQVSLVKHLNPEFHLQMGRALQALPEDVLVLGSGFTFHNMREFFAAPNAEKIAMNAAFEHWLRDTCRNPETSEKDRWEALANWEAAPHARFCHPREEHLLPLHVCYGVAQRACRKVYEVEVLGKQASMFLW